MHDIKLYRPNVGIVLFNEDKKIWIGRRLDTNPKEEWQLPQGGIDKQETPAQACAGVSCLSMPPWGSCHSSFGLVSNLLPIHIFLSSLNKTIPTLGLYSLMSCIFIIKSYSF